MQKQTCIVLIVHFTVLQTIIVGMKIQKSENNLKDIYTPKLKIQQNKKSPNVTLQERSITKVSWVFFCTSEFQKIQVWHMVLVRKMAERDINL